MSSEPKPGLSIGWMVLKWIGIIFVILFVWLFVMVNPLLFELGYLLICGWLVYLGNVLPRVEFNVEIALCAAVTLVLATVGLHRILRWWVKQRGENAEWRPIWTVKITAMVLLLFATSIAATGIVHQLGWLFGANQVVYMAGRGLITDDLNNMKQTGTALLMFAGDNDEKLPRDLRELVPKYSSTYRIFLNHTGGHEEPLAWIRYYADAPAANSSETIVAASPQPWGTDRVVAFRDGSARIIDEAEFQRLIRQQRGQ